jgi:MFS family permease
MNNTDIRLLGLASFASMASMRMCDPMLLQWSSDFNATAGQASHVIAAFAIAYGVMQLVYGPLGDRFSKVRLIAWATALSAALSVLTAWSVGIDSLLWSRSAMGAVAAGIIPMSMALIGDQVAYEWRQQTLARLMSATVTGLMAGQWFGGFAAQYLGWRWAFYALAMVYAIASVLLWRSDMLVMASGETNKGPVTLASYVRHLRDFFSRQVGSNSFAAHLGRRCVGIWCVGLHPQRAHQRFPHEHIGRRCSHVALWFRWSGLQLLCKTLDCMAGRIRLGHGRRRVDCDRLGVVAAHPSHLGRAKRLLGDWHGFVHVA